MLAAAYCEMRIMSYAQFTRPLPFTAIEVIYHKMSYAQGLCRFLPSNCLKAVPHNLEASQGHAHNPIAETERHFITPTASAQGHARAAVLTPLLALLPQLELETQPEYSKHVLNDT